MSHPRKKNNIFNQRTLEKGGTKKLIWLSQLVKASNNDLLC